MEAALSLTNSNTLCSSSSTPHPLAKPNPPPPTSLKWPGPAVKQPLLASTHLMFRSMATLVLGNVAAQHRPHTGPDPEREDSDAEGGEDPEWADFDAEGGEATDGEEEEEEAKELECMEAEAMAGKDEGRAPDDYDRRAHIFDQSARVFQHAHNRKDSSPGQ